MNQESKNRIAVFLGKSILKYHKKIKISFRPYETLTQGKIEYTGCANENELRVATGGDDCVWLGVFIHETCHLDQIAERRSWFSECEESFGIVSGWLGGQRSNKKKIEQSIKNVIELEWDCERRSLLKIKRNKLPINTKEYAQMANAYILGYHWTLKNRKWCKKSYGESRILKAMPAKLIPLTIAIYPTDDLMRIFDEN